MGTGVKLYETSKGWAHMCPACKHSHLFYTKQPTSNGAMWTFDGNKTHPTFEPSMVETVNPKDHKHYQKDAPTSVCHYWLRAGIITFLMDCTHEMRGMKVPLPDIPNSALGDPS